MDFEWDPYKAAHNLRLHGVSFTEAATVFNDDLGITIDDPLHSEDEDRYLIVGMSSRGRLLIVSHTDRNGRTRIVSARELTPKERRTYERKRQR